ncbi:hypothetical protein ARMGADRAFT_1029954 [Armillaria gallica]|uniref:Uncharacterized protein n=1 Tax=Armillaria gallica TaxID=47427 RepID=A0A2H3DFY8_ARMGA|nr:hypothetical protein ARMGADRAFT_1029954 [Armillaria gallica]
MWLGKARLSYAMSQSKYLQTTHMDGLKTEHNVATQFTRQHLVFLWDHINEYVNAIYSSHGDAWFNDMLGKFMAQFPDAVLDKRTLGDWLHFYSIKSLKDDLLKWMDNHGCTQVKTGYACDKEFNMTLTSICKVTPTTIEEMSAGGSDVATASGSCTSEETSSIDELSEEGTETLSTLDAQIKELEQLHDKLQEERNENTLLYPFQNVIFICYMFDTWKSFTFLDAVASWSLLSKQEPHKIEIGKTRQEIFY